MPRIRSGTNTVYTHTEVEAAEHFCRLFSEFVEQGASWHEDMRNLTPAEWYWIIPNEDGSNNFDAARAYKNWWHDHQAKKHGLSALLLYDVCNAHCAIGKHLVKRLGYICRVCGATDHSFAHYNLGKVCGECCSRYSRYREKTDKSFEEWLAHIIVFKPRWVGLTPVNRSADLAGTPS